MSYIDDDVETGRSCAGVITVLAAQLGILADGEDCELCHILEEFSHKLNILAFDLVKSTEAYGFSEAEKRGG